MISELREHGQWWRYKLDFKEIVNKKSFRSNAKFIASAARGIARKIKLDWMKYFTINLDQLKNRLTQCQPLGISRIEFLGQSGGT